MSFAFSHVVFSLPMIPWRKWGRGWLELIFPARCYLCRKGLPGNRQVICPDCLSRIPYLRSPLCSCCGKQFPDSSGGDHLCGSCLRQPPLFSRARAVVRYEAPVRQLLHRLKYAADSSTLPALAQIIGPFDHDFQPDMDCIVPVPLFSTRLKKRGLNQSQLLARLFFPEAGSALLVDILTRVRDTPPQTALDGAARRRNLRAAFAVSKPEAVCGRRVILVDDVFTTGTTVSECAKPLLAAGAIEVCVVTVARVEGWGRGS